MQARDSLVSATALRHELPIVIRNASDFADVVLALSEPLKTPVFKRGDG